MWTVARAVLCASATLAALGCAVGDGDLERWETTLEGPKRLSAVVLFNKYPHPLRVDAAMALIDMKPRKGQRVGIDRLVKGTLVCDASWIERKEGEPCRKTHLSQDDRAGLLKDLRTDKAVVPGIVSRVIEALNKPAPPPGQPDESIKFKDAAYMMLTYDNEKIVPDELRGQLLDALKAWAMADFERRLNDQTQMFGMEQLLRLIGTGSVDGLPALMSKDKLLLLVKESQLIKKLGSEATREAAGKKLIEIVDYIQSDKWKKERGEPELKAANDKGGLQPDAKQFAGQLDEYQEAVANQIYGAIKRVGGPSAVAFCLKTAADKKRKEKTRTAAIAALEEHIDKKDGKSVVALVALVKEKDTPKPVMDIALKLLKQLPREAVVKQLYELLDTDDWQVRRAVGATILQMSKLDNVNEFLDEIAKRVHKNFNPNEAQTYSAWIGDMKDGDPLEKLKPHFKDERLVVRITALAYFLSHGSKKDIGLLKPFADDKDKVGKCEEKAEGCTWDAFVPVKGKKKPEKKTMATVGDFVSMLLIPGLEQVAGKKDDKKDDKKSDAPKKKGG